MNRTPRATTDPPTATQHNTLQAEAIADAYDLFYASPHLQNKPADYLQSYLITQRFALIPREQAEDRYGTHYAARYYAAFAETWDQLFMKAKGDL